MKERALQSCGEPHLVVCLCLCVQTYTCVCVCACVHARMCISVCGDSECQKRKNRYCCLFVSTVCGKRKQTHKTTAVYINLLLLFSLSLTYTITHLLPLLYLQTQSRNCIISYAGSILLERQAFKDFCTCQNLHVIKIIGMLRHI